MKLKFNQLMKEARKEKGLSQREAAALCGLSEMMYRQYELGNRKPKQSNLGKIVKGLGLAWGEIYPEVHDGQQTLAFHLLDGNDEPVKQELAAPGQSRKVNIEVISLEEYLTGILSSISEDMRKLNEKGRSEAARRVHELTFIPMYTERPGSDSEKGDV